MYKEKALYIHSIIINNKRITAFVESRVKTSTAKGYFYDGYVKNKRSGKEHDFDIFAMNLKDLKETIRKRY